MSPVVPEYSESDIPADQKKYICATMARLSPGFVPTSAKELTTTRFFCRGAGYCFHFTPTSVDMVLTRRPGRQAFLGRRWQLISNRTRPKKEDTIEGVTLSLRFIGSNPSVSISGRNEEPGSVNFFIGDDPTKWRTHLNSYAEVVYHELWPGVDLVFRKTGGILKYDLCLKPGADLKAIRLAYDGADDLSLDSDGNLLIHIPLGVMTEQRSVSYRPEGEQRLPVATEFVLDRRKDGGVVFGFAAGAGYNPFFPLVIDPGLIYSTYLGGNCDDIGYGIAVDAAGNAYVTGYTASPDFPTTLGAFQTTRKGFTDAFVTKLNPTGTALVYSTYLGGKGDERGSGIKVDASGSAYVTGQTSSPDFPTIPGAFQPTLKGLGDAFVTKLNPAGNGLVYSTYLGGSGLDRGLGIAIDTGNNAFIAGATSSTDFPTTPGAFQTNRKGNITAFVTKLNATASTLIYSTYLGGSRFDEIYGIAIDSTDNAYVTGRTDSPDFPVTSSAFQTSRKGNTDAFVSKLNPLGSGLVYSTYLGGSNIDIGLAIAVNTLGESYVTGDTSSPDFPTTPGAFQTNLKGYNDAFVTKLNIAGTGLVYSTYLGGRRYDEGYGVVVDAAGNAYVTGHTSSVDFPTTLGAVQPTARGAGDVFITKLNPKGSALVYSTYLGGSSEENCFSDDEYGCLIISPSPTVKPSPSPTKAPDLAPGVRAPIDDEFGYGIAINLSGIAYVTGSTRALDFPTTLGAFQTTANHGTNAFVAKLDPVADILLVNLNKVLAASPPIKTCHRYNGYRSPLPPQSSRWNWRVRLVLLDGVIVEGIVAKIKKNIAILVNPSIISSG